MYKRQLINNPDLADTIMSRISADSFVTSFNKRVFSVLLERVKEMRSVSPMDISEAFTADEMSSITSVSYTHLDVYKRQLYA